MGKRIVFIWLLLAFAWVAKSQNYMIKGIVTDSITGEPLPYVAVILKGTTRCYDRSGWGFYAFLFI